MTLWLWPRFPLTSSHNGRYRSKPATKRSGRHDTSPACLPHSNLSISTGRSREAALAGHNVAKMAIPIAANAIHTPSLKLG